MGNNKARLGSLSQLLSELIKSKFVFDGKVVESMSPQSERLWRIIDKEAVTVEKCRYLFALFYNDKFSELEADLLKIEQDN